MSKYTVLAVAALALTLPVPLALAQPGTVDTSFGTAGTVTVPLKGYATLCVKTVQQPDGNILVAAATARTARDKPNVPPGTIQLVRLLANGALDTTFGKQGIATIEVPDIFVGPEDMQLQPDGKILVAGLYVDLNGTDHPPHHGIVVRFNTDGSLDRSFGTGGTVAITPLDGDSQDNPTVMLLQTDGEILVGDLPPVSSPELFRLETDGALDTSFGTGGVAEIPSNEPTQALALQSDGKIVALSTVAARLLPNGMPDPSTKRGTVVASSAAQALTGGPAVTMQPNDLYVIAAYVGSQSDLPELQRFTLANKRQTSFRDPAIRFSNERKKRSDNSVYAMVVQPDGSIVATGRYNAPHDQAFGLALVLANGKLDSGFGTNGSLTTAFPGDDARASAVTLQADGKIVVAGTAASSNDQKSTVAVARYLAQ